MKTRSTSAVALGLAAAAELGVGFLPLFGGPTYEAALAAGLLLPSIASVATALDVARRRPAPFEALGRGVTLGLAVGVIGLAVSILHGVRVGFCDAKSGIALHALGPLVGAVMGGAWGAAIGFVTLRKPPWRGIVAVLGALAGPLGGIAISIVRFYTSPMVFAFDPFFGYFAGPLYDTVFDPIWALASYRLGSALTLIALAAVAFHLELREDGPLRPLWRSRPGIVLLGVLAGAGSIAITAYGTELGHYSTTSSIRAALGRTASSARCDVIHPPEVLARDAELVARDCDAHLASVERYLGVRGPERVTVYLFASAEDKGRLTGASHTQIAKPWRGEIYLQAAPYPHPVLGHELAHVVAGAVGRGPFRVAGPLGGLLPDPGRIEGLAVAAAPDEDDDLTPTEWSRAMLDLRILPPLEAIFRLSFFGQNASKAYTVAGAFTSYLYETRGAEAIRRWYAGDDLRSITGKSLAELDQEFRTSLGRVTLAAEAVQTARARFDRPAIFGRSCPHEVDRLEQEGNHELGVNDALGCRQAFQQLLELDPEHVRARMGLGSCALRAGDPAGARDRWAAVTRDEKLPSVQRAAADEALADLDLLEGHVDAASSRYGAIERLLVDEDRLRTLDVKNSAVTDLGRAAILSLLVGDGRLGPSFEVAAAELGEWAATSPDDGLPDYLLGRNFYQRGRLIEAAAHLDRSLARKLSSPRVLREALRLRMVVGCAMSDRDRARAAYERFQKETTPTFARRQALAHLAERCQIASAAP